MSIGRGDGWPKSKHHRLLLRDPEVSRTHAVLRYNATYRAHVIQDRSRHGTFVNGSRITEVHLGPGDVIRMGGTLFVVAISREPAHHPMPQPAPAARSLPLQAVHAEIDELAPTRTAVMIYGPTGAGKELIARRLHARSGRKGPLIALNCGAISDYLVEAEFFGAVEGAGTAVAERQGVFRAAHGGTLFLDEVADLKPRHQNVLLRTLEDGQVRAVGADKAIHVDIRVVSATHKALNDLVSTGAFREDLLGRLTAATVTLRGLAERREEIVPLIQEFVGDDNVDFSPRAIEALLNHGWPRNVRELRQVVERAMITLRRNRGPFDRRVLPAYLHGPKTRLRSKDPRTPRTGGSARCLSRPDSSAESIEPPVDKPRPELPEDDPWIDMLVVPEYGSPPRDVFTTVVIQRRGNRAAVGRVFSKPDGTPRQAGQIRRWAKKLQVNLDEEVQTAFQRAGLVYRGRG